MVKPNPNKRFGQKQFTKTLLALGNFPIGKFSSIYQSIWTNPIDDNSLRLSAEGFKFLVSDLKLKSYSFDLPMPLVNRDFLLLERFFPSPYYILSNKKFVVFEESEATMLTLRGDDIVAYLRDLDQVSDY